MTLLSIFRPSSWPGLSRRLDAAVQRDAALAHARDVLVRPVQLLDLMARDAAAALADDALAAERLRMVLHLSWPFAGFVEEARTLLEAEGKDHGARYQAGVIDHGALLVVAVAALRVAPRGLPGIFLRTVHGLALAAASAEVLGRLGEGAPDGDALAILLNVLYLLDSVGAAAKTPFLRPFATDPVERARWRVLARLLDAKPLESLVGSAAEWDGAWADGLDEVTLDGERVILRGSFELGRDASVVFAAAERPLVAGAIKKREQRGDLVTLEVEVPPRATSGWIGFCNDKRIHAANRHREAVRDKLPALATAALLGGARVPVHAITPIGHVAGGHLLAEPPRTGANSFSREAALAVHVEAAATADGAAEGPGAAGGASARFEPLMTSAVGGDVLPIVLVRPRILDGAEVQPAVDAGDARRLVEALGASLKIKLAVWELPWIDDALAALVAPITSHDDARIPSLLQALARRAMLTPGFESAVWVLLVPSARELDAAARSFARSVAHPIGVGAWQPATAARALLVADPSGLAELLPRVLAPPASPSPRLADVGPRLRVLGQYNGAFDFESVVEEVRAAGPGPAAELGITAFALDGAGRELYAQPVRVLQSTLPAQVTLLLPVSAEVAAIDLRGSDGATLTRISRTPGEPRLDDTRLDGETLTWHYSHTRNARPRLSLWIATRGHAPTPAIDLDPCASSWPRLPLHRFADVGAMWLTASDGWNQTRVSILGSTAVKNAHPLVLRRLSDGRYFADGDAPARWLLDGRDLGQARAITLPSGSKGMLMIESKGQVDWRVLS